MQPPSLVRLPLPLYAQAAGAPQQEDLNSCPICLDELSMRTITACGHHFCPPCIREVLAHGSRLCPICRHGELWLGLPLGCCCCSCWAAGLLLLPPPPLPLPAVVAVIVVAFDPVWRRGKRGRSAEWSRGSSARLVQRLQRWALCGPERWAFCCSGCAALLCGQSPATPSMPWAGLSEDDLFDAVSEEEARLNAAAEAEAAGGAMNADYGAKVRGRMHGSAEHAHHVARCLLLSK